MNKNCFHIHSIAYLLVLLVICSCSGCKRDSKTNPMVEELDNTPDYAELVTLIDIDGDSLIVQPDNEAEQPKAYAYKDAKEDGNVIGRLEIGDMLSILSDSKSHNIQICINVTELKGRWFYDMEQHRGFRFEERGALSSLNTEDISFKEWKLLNGKLYIYYVDMQQVSEDRHEFEVSEAKITHLTGRSLQLEFRDSVYNCKREDGLLMFH